MTWTAAERAIRRSEGRQARRCSNSQAAAITANIGISRMAEYFATHARPKRVALAAAHLGPGCSRWRHQAPAAARKKNVMMTSDVASAPCARKVGEKMNNASETKAARQPNNARDQKNTSSPVATLNRATMAR